jgi:hypothetical protein
VQFQVTTTLLLLFLEVVDPRLGSRDRHVVGDGPEKLLETKLHTLSDVLFDIVHPGLELTVI